jgi:hypothetical protein
VLANPESYFGMLLPFLSTLSSCTTFAARDVSHIYLSVLAAAQQLQFFWALFQVAPLASLQKLTLQHNLSSLDIQEQKLPKML